MSDTAAGTVAGSSGRILVAEDSLVIRTVVSEQLMDAGYDVVQAIDGEAALAQCAATRPDAILLDIEMPGLDGHQVLARLKQDEGLRDIPVVFLTGRTGTDEMVAGLREGAHDYLRKPFEPAELLARIGGAVRIKRLQDELRERNEELKYLSETDGLTGATNRRHIDGVLDRFSGTSRRHQEPYALVMFDIDHFKSVNDTEGHPGGDQVLRELVVRLRSIARDDDVVGRWGGEEFVIIAPRTTIEGAAVLAERARLVVAERSFAIGDHDIAVTVSAGCASGIGEYPASLVRRADQALYESKLQGRNRVTCSSPHDVIGHSSPQMMQ